MRQKAGAVMRSMIGRDIIRPMPSERYFTVNCLPSGCLIAVLTAEYLTLGWSGF
nr:hypothetical protein [Neisseria yangbaofengii]